MNVRWHYFNFIKYNKIAYVPILWKEIMNTEANCKHGDPALVWERRIGQQVICKALKPFHIVKLIYSSVNKLSDKFSLPFTNCYIKLKYTHLQSPKNNLHHIQLLQTPKSIRELKFLTFKLLNLK